MTSLVCVAQASSPASSSGVPPRRPTPGGTPGKLAGEDACATGDPVKPASNTASVDISGFGLRISDFLTYAPLVRVRGALPLSAGFGLSTVPKPLRLDKATCPFHWRFCS